MNNFLKILITLLVFLCVFNSGYAAQEDMLGMNLIENPGFEEEDYLVGWKPFHGFGGSLKIGNSCK